MKLPQFLRRKKPSPPAPDAPEPLREEGDAPAPPPSREEEAQQYQALIQQFLEHSRPAGKP